MKCLKVFFYVFSIFIINNVYADNAHLNEKITSAIYSEDYQAFSKAYKQIGNKNSILFTKGYLEGTVVFYLSWAIDVKDPNFFDLIVEHANPNLPNEYGSTAIFVASSNCDLDKAKKLIAKGANINLSLKDSGLTPLHAVATSECYSIANLLLEQGADKQAKTTLDKLTPYDMAMKSGFAQMAKLLKSK